MSAVPSRPCHLSQQGTVIRFSDACPRREQVSEPLAHLCQRLFLGTLGALCHERPASQEHGPRQIVRKPLFSTEVHGRFGLLLHEARLPAELMQHGGIAVGERQAEGVGQVLGQSRAWRLRMSAWSG